MAITTAVVSKAAGWARTDVIYQLEEAFALLRWHGSTQTGIITGISSYTGGGTVGTSNTDYQDVFQTSTSGIGTGASFNVNRTTGAIVSVLVNRPGVGYTNGEVVQLSAEDIGGSANGAVGMAITVLVAGGGSPIGFGSTTQFYDKDVIPGSVNPWGVLRHTIQPNKRFGDTYRLFQSSAQNLFFYSGSGFNPSNIRNTANRGNGYEHRFAGTFQLDVPWDPLTGYAYTSASNVAESYPFWYQANIQYASSNSYKLDLNIYQSSIDPKFVVFSYKQPTLSSLKLRDNTFATFILHNFTSTLWDYDNLFLGGMTAIIASTDENNPYLEFRTYATSNTNNSNESSVTKRCAEYGFIASTINDTGNEGYKSTVYQPNSYPKGNNSSYSGLYVRYNDPASHRGRGGDNYTTAISSNSNFNAVIKGIPLNALMVPIPYYIPDDFVLMEFDYAAPSANIQQGDTITISGSEIYTVISGSYNQTTRTRGILFCARTT